MHRPSLLLTFSFLLILTSVNGMIGNPAAYDLTDSTSFHCGRKIFLAEIIKDTMTFLSSPRRPRLIPKFDGNLKFRYRGLLRMWPLPAQYHNHIYKTNHFSPFQVVFADNDHTFLGVVEGKRDEGYVHCTKANAGGVITSVSSLEGGFNCNGIFISTKIAIESVIDLRTRLQKTKHKKEMKYPSYYEGELRFEGVEPHQLWPISKNGGNVNPAAKQSLVIDLNMDIVDALYRTSDGYKRCARIEGNTPPISNSIYPLTFDLNNFPVFKSRKN